MQVGVPEAWKDPVVGEAIDEVNVDLTTSVWYAMSDIPAIIANCQLLEIFHHFVGRAVISIQTGLKYSSIGGLITGILQTIQAWDKKAKADEIGDVGGQKDAQIRITRGFFEIASGAVMLGVRSLSVLASRHSSKIILASQAALGVVSTCVASVYFALIALPFVFTGVKAHNLLDELERKDGDYNRLQHLYRVVGLSEQEWNRAESNARVGNDTPRGLTQREIEVLSRRDVARIENFPKRRQVSLAQEIAHLYLRKEAKCHRRGLRESVKLLREARLNNRSVNTNQIVPMAVKEMTFHRKLSAALVTTCAIGIVSFVLATAVVSVPLLTFAFTLMLVMNVAMGILDGYCLYSEVQATNKLGTKDKMVMGAFGVLTVGCMVAGTVLSAGLFEVALVLGSGALMLATQVATMAKVHFNQKRQQEAQIREIELAQLK